jgi:hypothetical protein
MVRGMGFVEVSVRPLMDAALWHEVPRHSRYAVLARSPERPRGAEPTETL